MVVSERLFLNEDFLELLIQLLKAINEVLDLFLVAHNGLIVRQHVRYQGLFLLHNI